MSSSDKFKRYLLFSNAPSIVRSNQKDSYFENLLNSELTDVVKIFKNSRFIHKYPEELRSISRFLYLALTTLVGSKTLGEEYVDLVYVDRSGKKIPKFAKRLGFILSYVLVPYLLKRFLKHLSTDLEDEEQVNGSHQNHNVSFISKVRKALSKVTYFNLIDLMNLHLALFYFTGKYYQLSKRLFGLRYAFAYQVDTKQRKQRGNYELLGLLIVLQSFFKNISTLKKLLPYTGPNPSHNEAVNNSDIEKNDLLYSIPELNTETPSTTDSHHHNTDIVLSDPSVLPYIPENSRSCMLCLSYMTNPTCGLCGHMFCWSCIMDWCKERKECPLCRAAIKESNLLPLR
ncbi:hypothetical protein CANARDRAFT_10182 [[Candida] arabinofermentans NRRL YB-2248]|uniref:RING-type E3 ubiquitin transferase n=1 Tax=[Candida] arabinofermentans NRRL YB-2248 TaxID=983967 RepID=A0A1E4STH1_9ASCO|nr:hypothetical protein CANARDRAFT_10182 [[Candida] arabinofermentans NRRL YB-2248]